MKKQILLLLPLGLILFSAWSFRPADSEIPEDVKKLLSKYSCSSCHHVSRNLIGPSWPAIAQKKYSKKRIIQLVAKPEPGNWPNFQPMAPQPNIPKEDMNKIASWLEGFK
ncbi:MAG: hypothetical protein R2792_06220 [Saprospiraceae bacterium]